MLRILDLPSSSAEEDEQDDQGEYDERDSTDGASDDGSRTRTRARAARCIMMSTTVARTVRTIMHETHLPFAEPEPPPPGRPPPPPTPEIVGAAAPGAMDDGELSEIHPDPPGPTVNNAVLHRIADHSASAKKRYDPSDRRLTCLRFLPARRRVCTSRTSFPL